MIEYPQSNLHHWITRLKDPDWAVRWTAIIRLRSLKDTRAIAPLMEALRVETHWGVRWALTEALGQLGDQSLVEPLSAMLVGFPTYLRASAAWILGALKAQQAVEPLMQALADHNWFGRAQAAWALGEIGDWKAIPALMQVFHDLEPSVQDAAKRAVQKIFAAVQTVVFGEDHWRLPLPRVILRNPDANTLRIPLSNLKIIGIHADTYNFHLVERFLTYALEHLGQTQLKQRVEVYIYGNVERLHPNLRNNFINLCKHVKVFRVALKTP